MKLKTLAKEITALARQHIGGCAMKVELGIKCGKINGEDAESVNWSLFDDEERTDLVDWLSRAEWEKLELTDPHVELDFYISGSRRVGDYHELQGNLGVIIENGVLTKWCTSRQRWTPYEPARPTGD